MQASGNNKLLGKVALITGAGNGIGAETARLFTKFGATVSLLDVDKIGLKSVADECEKLIAHAGQSKPLILVGSVSDADVCKRYVENTIKAFSKIDILINNAGVTKYSNLADSPLEDFDRIMDINIRAVLQLTQLAVPYLIQTQGSVVSLSSVSAHRVVKGRLFYAMSKACITQFTKYVAEELGNHKVRVNCISPGVVKTDICLNYNMTKEQLPKYFEQAERSLPLQRCADTSEVAQLIAFLSSEEASYITGTDTVIDGGLLVATQSATKPINE